VREIVLRLKVSEEKRYAFVCDPIQGLNQTWQQGKREMMTRDKDYSR
jgi:hypothetical protein